jgi:hypothetical protein
VSHNPEPESTEKAEEVKKRHPWAAMGWEVWGMGASMGSAAAALMLLIALIFMLRFAG